MLIENIISVNSVDKRPIRKPDEVIDLEVTLAEEAHGALSPAPAGRPIFMGNGDISGADSQTDRPSMRFIRRNALQSGATAINTAGSMDPFSVPTLKSPAPDMQDDRKPSSDKAAPGIVRLSSVRRGFRGQIVRVQVDDACRVSALEPEELERRLLEMGFMSGAPIALLHEGLIGGDPIAVQLGSMRVALRRREADGVWVTPDVQGAQG